MLPVAEAKKVASEEVIKAAFVYRFAQYTTWPEPLGDRFNLCVYGNGKIVNSIEEYQGRSVQGSTIEVILPVANRNLAVQCHAVYVGVHDRGVIRSIVASIIDESILIISDFPNALDERTDIALSTEPNSITFSINLTQAKKRNFSFSGQMLKLAQRVL